MIRHYPLTLALLIAVTTLCLIPLEDPPLKDVKFIDKWMHIVMFGSIACVMLYEMWKNSLRHPFLLAAMASSLYGGAVELMQANLTTYRSGEWLDFAADAAGAFAAVFACWTCYTLFFRKSTK